MQTGTKISAAGHGALVLLAIFGLPWFGPRERETIRVTEVSFVTEAEFDAAQAAASAEAPREPTAPPVPPRARPAPAEPAPEPEAASEPEAAPEVSEAPPEPPAQEVATLEPPAEPAPDRITPRVVTVDPPSAATPPRARPAPRVEPNPTPPPEDALRPAETPEPVTAPEPEAEVARVEETPAAPPEASPEPEAEAVPRAPLALRTASRPLPRSGRRPPEAEQGETESVTAAIQREVDSQIRRLTSPTTRPTPATEPTAPTETPPTEAAATSLPVGPPLTSSEKDGLKFAVQQCWNMPAGLRDAQELKVTLAAELAADGEIINASIRLIEPRQAPDARFRQAYEAGRRALLRCSPYELPREKYAQWRNIEVVFNPEGMVSW
jgi:hypothetical protein